MRARSFLTAAVIGCAVCTTFGQAGTADGVAALARGDYQRAVEILKPIAEDWRVDDPAAQFFMAGLYDTGRGVPMDALRACALYMRASMNRDSPFGRQADRFAAVAAVSGGPEFDEECQFLANIGLDNGFEPVTFDLGPGHSVTFTLAAATVSYRGGTKRTQILSPERGARLLPLQYTPLATGPTRSLTRHFIEIFVWRPSARVGPWLLDWWLFEVLGDEIVHIETSDTIAMVAGVVPPSPGSFDVREHAELRVDDGGHAEWTVLKGSSRLTERIESEEERREIREEALAREAARRRVDWTRRHDMRRQPTLAYVDADGCGNIQLYGWSADYAEAVVMRADGAVLGLSTQPATLDLRVTGSAISVDVYVYGAAQPQFDFCTDALAPKGPEWIAPETWRAVAGSVTIALSAEGIRARAPHQRRATVTLRNLELRNAVGKTVRITGPVTLTAIVGHVWG